MRREILFGLSLALLLPASTAAAAESRAPVAVSPGENGEVSLVENRCPTFSWSALEDAKGYELVVYRIDESGEASQEILNRHFEGPVSSWTPSLQDCLERGSQYAWAVLAQGESAPSDWSQPSLFQVAGGPSQEEFEEALVVVRQYLAAGTAGMDTLPVARAKSSPGRAAVTRPDLSTKEASIAAAKSESVIGERGATTAGLEAFGVAALTVEGEVRTVTSTEAPRLWGRGRPGSVRNTTLEGLCTNEGARFGLSSIAVNWGSAADACPAGTWVCTEAERGNGWCNTLRADTTSNDYLECDGSGAGWQPDHHLGWLADQYDGYRARARSERGITNWIAPTCLSFPVWCCSE